jgi:hypothetical protein
MITVKTVADFWNGLLPEIKKQVIATMEIPEQLELAMENENIDYDEFWDYVCQISETEVAEKENEEIKEVKNEEFVISQTTQQATVKEVANSQSQVTQQVLSQQVVNNVTVNVEQPKNENRKLSIAEKVAEAQKMLAVAEKKEFYETKLKDFYGYLNGNRDGDNFTLSSTDKSYKFNTNNFELIREVNEVIEKHFKSKIQGFENLLQNFQLL